MKFSHPLARSAKIWPIEMTGGAKENVLVVVTTLELDPEEKKFKAEQVERLRAAIGEYLSERPGKAGGFLLMNKPKS